MIDNFSSRIKELRKILNQTQAQFAEFIGTTQGALSGYENGDRTPSYEILITIAKKCNVSVDWLCGLSDRMVTDNHITTYKDLFQLLTSVLGARYENEENTPIIDSVDIVKSQTVCLLLHDDPNFQTFFPKWYNIFKLYCDGTIDNDLYQMWLKKQFERYKNWPINGCPF